MANSSAKKEIAKVEDTTAQAWQKFLKIAKWTARLLLDSPVDENNNEVVGTKVKEERSTVRDAIGILSGIFVALVFIAATSYEIRYITTRPSQDLTDSEMMSFNISKHRMLRATVAKLKPVSLVQKDQVCPYKIGQEITLTMPKSLAMNKQWLSNYNNQTGGSLLLHLQNPPAGMQCIDEISVQKSALVTLVNN